MLALRSHRGFFFYLQKKKKKETGDKPERVPFSRESDLQVCVVYV